jgi:hypothetical protein
LPDPELLERAKAVGIAAAQDVAPMVAMNGTFSVRLSFLTTASKRRKGVQVPRPQSRLKQRYGNLGFPLDGQKERSSPAK